MRVTVPPELRDFVREMIDLGRYRDESDAVIDGLRMLREKEREEFEALKNLLHERVEESKRGESVVWNEKVKAGIRRRGMKRLAALLLPPHPRRHRRRTRPPRRARL